MKSLVEQQKINFKHLAMRVFDADKLVLSQSTPYQVIAEFKQTRVRFYASENKRYREPLVFTAPLAINMDIYDLYPYRSLIKHFQESGFGEKPVWRAFVAEESLENNKNILGFALYYIRYSTWKGQRMYLEDLIVTEAARGKGIGKILFDALIEEAAEKKFSGIVWQVLEWNEPAINFYKKYNADFDPEWINCSIPV